MFNQILGFLGTSDHKLTEIDLKSRNIVDEDVKVLVDAMKEGNSHKVVTLNLINNHIHLAGATALATLIESHSSLTKLQLQLNNIGPEGAIALAGALKDGGCRLKCLHLKSCGISASGAMALANALEDTKCPLEDLRLDQNNIGDEGACAIGRALSRNNNSCLFNLELKGNSIGPLGARGIAEALIVNHSLEALGLNDNPIGDKGVVAIAEALRINKNTALNWLFLSNIEKCHRIGRRGVDKICNVLYDDGNPENVFFSNHTLKEIYGVPSEIQPRLRRLLRFNKLGVYKARREKITMFLSENPNYMQSSGIDLKLIPRILYKAGREHHGSLDTMYKHIRENPDILPDGKHDGIEKVAPQRKGVRLWRRGHDQSSGRKADASSFADLDAALLNHCRIVTNTTA